MRLVRLEAGDGDGVEQAREEAGERGALGQHLAERDHRALEARARHACLAVAAALEHPVHLARCASLRVRLRAAAGGRVDARRHGRILVEAQPVGLRVAANHLPPQGEHLPHVSVGSGAGAREAVRLAEALIRLAIERDSRARREQVRLRLEHGCSPALEHGKNQRAGTSWRSAMKLTRVPFVACVTAL